MNQHDYIPGLEEEYAELLSREIQREIDTNIMESFVLESVLNRGWTSTKINPAFGDITASIDWFTLTAEWCHKNATGDYKLVKGQWLFELESDALLFILRWS